jgi:hypothetical protein
MIPGSASATLRLLKGEIMRAYLTEQGCLRIVPENTTERFALNHWLNISELPIENGESRINGKYLVVGPEFTPENPW